MKADEILIELLGHIRLVKDDSTQLQRILDFIKSEIKLPEEEEIQLPDKYSKVVRDIADNLSAGFICFMNTETLETDYYPPEMLPDPEEYETEEDMINDGVEYPYLFWDDYLTFKPLESYESFRIMEAFANQIDNKKVSSDLFELLSRNKPFARFKQYIENSKYRADWFAFSDKWLQGHVKEIIFEHINLKNYDSNRKKHQNGNFEGL
jgi:hypothetical protein